MREKTIQKGFKKICNIINRMENNTSLDDIREDVKITRKLLIEVHCFRHEDDDLFYGEPYMYEIYAIKENEPVDCVTFIARDKRIESDVMYLLNCYV